MFGNTKFATKQHNWQNTIKIIIVPLKYTIIHAKYQKPTFVMHFYELLPKKNAKLGQQIKFSKKKYV